MKIVTVLFLLSFVVMFAGCGDSSVSDSPVPTSKYSNDSHEWEIDGNDEGEAYKIPGQSHNDDGNQSDADNLSENETQHHSAVVDGGDPITSTRITSVCTNSNAHLAINQDGALLAWGDTPGNFGNTFTYPQTIVPGDVIFIDSGHAHALYITSDNTLWVWGKCNQSSARPIPVLDNVVYAAVAPGLHNAHAMYSMRSFAIRADNSLWAWGSNEGADIRGFLGDGTDVHRHETVHIMANVASVTPTITGALVITNDNILWGFGNIWRDPWGDFDPILSPQHIMDNIAQVTACGLAISTTGDLWDLKLHAFQPYGEPFKVQEPALLFQGAIYARRTNTGIFVIASDHTLVAWGGNQDAADHWNWGPPLGNGTSAAHDDLPGYILSNVAHFEVAGNTAFAITRDGRLFGWGGNTGLGNANQPCIIGGSLSPVLIMESVSQIATSYATDHGWVVSTTIFIITECGALWAMGGSDGEWGSLGDGTTNRLLQPTLILCRMRH